jgi:HSP20 family protein
MLITRLNNNYFDNLLKDFYYEEKEYKKLKTNIIENDDSYTMELLVPGFNKEDINITLNDEYLTIEVNKKEEKEYLLKEINNYSYKRNYYVGKIELSDIKANLNNGILTLTIQKVKEKEKEIQKVTIE